MTIVSVVLIILAYLFVGLLTAKFSRDDGDWPLNSIEVVILMITWPILLMFMIGDHTSIGTKNFWKKIVDWVNK